MAQQLEQIDRADDVCRHIADLIDTHLAMVVECTVNDDTSEDSPVEHHIDLDVTSGDRVFNVRIEVIRFM